MEGEVYPWGPRETGGGEVCGAHLTGRCKADIFDGCPLNGGVAGGVVETDGFGPLTKESNWLD